MFHRLTHEMEKVKQSMLLSDQAKNEQLKILNNEVEKIGGRKAYQDASILSTKYHRTSKWVFQQLTTLDRRPKSKQPKLRVLEVSNIIIGLYELVQT